MAPTNEDHASLGKIHENYNKLMQNAISNKKELDEKSFTIEKLDTDNLMKIDIACHNKNIDYILSVLKSEDMLYVSRAIKQSPWLVDDQYEHIINPEYLNNELLPLMTTKAGIKLLKHIRHHLKIEKRVEDFYKNETSAEKAGKWLTRCSIPFIIENIDKHMHTLRNLEYKRLCEQSVTIFEASMKKFGYGEKLKVVSFLLRTHADKYLDVFESAGMYCRPNFGPKTTELMMKQSPDRIKNNLLIYIYNIHVPTFVQYLKREEVADFLYKLANKQDEEHYFRRIFKFDVLKHFVKRMPKEEQFEFVKKVFLNKNIIEIKDESLTRGTEIFAVKRICTTVCSATPSYHWYEFASFNTAFSEIKKLIHAEANMDNKYSMLDVLLKCAGTDTEHLLSLLKYYYKNHLNDDSRQKENFVSELLSQTEIYKNGEIWNTYTDIFKNMNVYTENDNQVYLKFIVLYHVLRSKEVPETIMKNFSFSTFQEYRSKLNQNEQNKIFEYLLNYVMKNIESHIIQTEEHFNESIQWHYNVLDLLMDWNKQIIDYPVILDKIKNLIRIRNENDWNTDLSSLYNTNKSWKRYMFEESLLLNPSQEVCVNALKHDPGLLMRYNNNVKALCRNNDVSVKQLLRKIRIYWPESLADHFTKFYLERLNELGGHKALTCGLFTLLSPEPAFDIIKKYAPVQAKIDWNNIDELTLSLQRCIAKTMHIARPHPSADAIILYAKSDYLQYALPSLNAIYYNMSRAKSQQHVPKLLNAPVSLQKHGLRFAFIKLKHEELKFHLANVWKTTKNITIRAVTFVLLFELMCKEKDDGKAIELWEILEVCMDNLSFEEDKKIYEILPKVENVPLVIRPKFLIKSYNFLKKLLPHVKNDRSEYEYAIDKLAKYTREVMEFICPDFVSDIITEFLTQKFFNGETNPDNEMLKVLSSYLLCARDEGTQNKKYEQILVPLIKRCLDQWNETQNDEYYIRNHFEILLTCLSDDLHDYAIENEMIVPTKMFHMIKKELDTNLVVTQNYIMLTMWKLIVKLSELIDENDERDDWNELCSQIIPRYSKFCLEVLKEDVKLYFSCIYILYSNVLDMAMYDIFPDTVSLQFFEHMLSDTDFIQAYLVTVKILSKRRYYWYGTDELKEWKKRENEMRKTIRNHPSVEVKMHYYSAFNNDDEYDGDDDEE